MNFLQQICSLTNLESKLSVQTSALSECRSEDPDDQVLNPVKNLTPSPSIPSSLLSLVWWFKDTTTEVHKSSIFKYLNKLKINPCYQQLFTSFLLSHSNPDIDFRGYNHIVFSVINKNDGSKTGQIYAVSDHKKSKIAKRNNLQKCPNVMVYRVQNKLMKSNIFRNVTIAPIRSINMVVYFELTYFPITLGDEVR